MNLPPSLPNLGWVTATRYESDASSSERAKGILGNICKKKNFATREFLRAPIAAGTKPGQTAPPSPQADDSTRKQTTYLPTWSFYRKLECDGIFLFLDCHNENQVVVSV